MTERAVLPHRFSRTVSRAQLAKIPTPAKTPTYQPVPFLSLIKVLEAELRSRGVKITAEQFAVSRGNTKMFGVLDLSLNGINGGCAAMGFRTSHDKRIAVKIIAGARVFVCDNLTMSGELVALRREHTKRLDLSGEIKAAVDRYQEHYVVLKDRITVLQTKPISEPEADSFMLEAFCEKRPLLPLHCLRQVRTEWLKPSYSEFAPRTWWSLLNAFTHAAKQLPLGVQSRVSVEIGKRLLSA